MILQGPRGRGEAGVDPNRAAADAQKVFSLQFSPFHLFIFSNSIEQIFGCANFL
jgi:hypothetical protein